MFQTLDETPHHSFPHRTHRPDLEVLSLALQSLKPYPRLLHTNGLQYLYHRDCSSLLGFVLPPPLICSFLPLLHQLIKQLRNSPPNFSWSQRTTVVHVSSLYLSSFWQCYFPIDPMPMACMLFFKTSGLSHVFTFHGLHFSTFFGWIANNYHLPSLASPPTIQIYISTHGSTPVQVIFLPSTSLTTTLAGVVKQPQKLLPHSSEPECNSVRFSTANVKGMTIIQQMH